MTTKFELILIVPAKLVGTIVELMEDSGVLVSMKPHNHTPKRVQRHHEPGMTADDLMAQFIKAVKGQFTYKQVEEVFKAKGFKPGTASSRLAMAKSKKLIRAIGSIRSGLYEKV